MAKPDKNEHKLMGQVRYGSDLTREVKPWPRIQATEACRTSGALQSCLGDGIDRVSTWPSFVRELFGRLYTGDRCKPLDQPRQEAAYASSLHAMLNELPEWQRLTQRCRGDSYSAASASVGMGERMREHIPVHEYDAEGARRRAELLQEEYEELCADMARQGQPLPPEPPGLAKAKAEHQKAQQEATHAGEVLDDAASMIRNAARNAVQKANAQMDDIDQALAACGWGAGDAGPGRESAGAVKEYVASQLAQTERLNEIFDLAGRLKDVMRQAQASKVRQGAGELTDVESGDAVARLLPSELILMRHKLARYLLARKLHEKSALQYRLEDRERKGKGPVVVCIDDSGSMSGSRDTWAKAVALALLELARKQKRDFCFCTFSTRLTFKFAEKAKAKTPPQDLITALLHHSGGGTKFDPPLDWALHRIAKADNMKEADVIFISDGDCRAADASRHKAKAKDLGARILGIAVGPSAVGATGEGTMQDFCDQVYPVTELRLDREDAERDSAARAVLAI
jgi:uncharacterized protein with von Willebrand factor type A (vWA) domain